MEGLLLSVKEAYAAKWRKMSLSMYMLWNSGAVFASCIRIHLIHGMKKQCFTEACVRIAEGAVTH
jgi:hypothetical protein